MEKDPSSTDSETGELLIGMLWLDSTLRLRAFDPVLSQLIGISTNDLHIGVPIPEAVSLPAEFRIWIARVAMDSTASLRWTGIRFLAGMAPVVGGGWSIWIMKRQRVSGNSSFLGQALAALPCPVFYLDCQGNYLDCNIAFENFFGKSMLDFLGKTAATLVPDAIVKQAAEANRRLLQGAVQHDFLAVLERVDGSLRDVLVTKAAFHDASGKIAGFVGALIDMTEQKRVERELRLSASVFENATEAITITDATPRILKVNRAFTEITGYSAQEVLGKNPSVLSSGRQNAAFYGDLWQQLKEKGTWFGEIWNRRRNGDVYPEWLSISAVRNIEGVSTHYIAVFTDISIVKANGGGVLEYPLNTLLKSADL